LYRKKVAYSTYDTVPEYKREVPIRKVSRLYRALL
jgi:hypothetical protein